MRLDDPYLNLYNPGNIPREQFLFETSARGELFDALLRDIRTSTDAPPPQHHLLVGPRGMGKTSALYMVKYRVEQDVALSATWRPVLFDEEEYGIGDLADFWLECTRNLEGPMEVFDGDSADKLLLQSPEDLEAEARELFLGLLKEDGRRGLLLIDNLNDVLSTLGGEAQHRLRAFLMEDERLLVVGTAASWFSAVRDKEAPFFEFFRPRYLERFSGDEMEKVLRQLAEAREDVAVLEVLDTQPERLRSLRILTGGNPRLVKMIYGMLKEGIESDVRRDLERLLDECTPFFKHRIESLSLQARRVFDRIAKHWDPIGVADIAPFVRKTPSYVSSVINKLIDDGFVEEAGGTGKRKTYQVAERFYNIYYLMRFSREGRNRLRFLVGFMRVFYGTEDYERWLAHWADRLRAGETPSQDDDGYCFLSSLAEASGDRGMKQRIYQEMLSSVDPEKYEEVARYIEGSDLREAIGQEGFNVVEYFLKLPKEHQAENPVCLTDADWWYSLAAWFYGRGSWEPALAAVRKTIELNPDSPEAWNGLGILLTDHVGDYNGAQEAFELSIELAPDAVHPRNGLGNLLTERFGDHAGARALYEKAIELNPECAVAWYNLGLLLNEYFGDYIGARAAYEKAIKLEPEAAESWNNLGNLLAVQFGEYAGAQEAFEKAIELNPRLASPCSGLAELYIGQGNLRAALGYLLNSFERSQTFRPVHHRFLEHWATNGDAITQLLDTLVPTLAEESVDPSVTLFVEAVLRKWIAAEGSGMAAEVVSALPELPAIQPLILGVQSLEDPSVLAGLAPEMRVVVEDVAQRLSGGSEGK